MTTVIRCKDVGFDCPAVVRAPNEQEALKQAAEHAKSAHGVKELTPDIVSKVRSVMKTE